MTKKTLKEPIPKKRDPGDRARQELSGEEAKKLADIARQAAELKANTDYGQKKEAFISLQKASGMTRETLLRWARLYESLQEGLARHLRRHGKSKMYVLSYLRNPKKALREGISDPEKKGAVVNVSDINAEALRLLIRRAFPDRSRKQWFRLHRTPEGERSADAVQTTLEKITGELGIDVERINRLMQKSTTAEERDRVREFQSQLRGFTSSIAKNLAAAEARAKAAAALATAEARKMAKADAKKRAKAKTRTKSKKGRTR